MASYIRLTEQDDAGVPTPPSSKVNIFVDDSTHEPSYKDSSGTVNSLKGEKGDTGAGVDELTTKGDLLGFDGSDPDRLAVGTDGQVLTADSNESLGVKWATPATAPVTSVNGATGTVSLGIDDLDDVDDTSKADGYVLAYDSDSGNMVYVEQTGGGGGSVSWGGINGTLSDQTDLKNALDAKQDELTGLTASVSELNILDGATLSTTELNYVDGVTSAIQTQIDGKPDDLADLGDVDTTGVSDGDVLTYDSDTSTWVPAAGGGGGSSPLTTKGDIYTYGSNDARLPIGTNGQILTADSTQTLGLKWSAPGLPEPSNNGLVIRTGSGTVTSRAITGTSNEITVTNGDGISGNPTISAHSNLARLSTAQTWSGGQTFSNGVAVNGGNFTCTQPTTISNTLTITGTTSITASGEFTVTRTSGAGTINIYNSNGDRFLFQSAISSGSTNSNNGDGMFVAIATNSKHLFCTGGASSGTHHRMYIDHNGAGVTGRLILRTTGNPTTASSGAYCQTPSLDITGTNDAGTAQIDSGQTSESVTITDLAATDVVVLSYNGNDNGGGALWGVVSAGSLTINCANAVSANTSVNWRVIH